MDQTLANLQALDGGPPPELPVLDSVPSPTASLDATAAAAVLEASGAPEGAATPASSAADTAALLDKLIAVAPATPAAAAPAAEAVAVAKQYPSVASMDGDPSSPAAAEARAKASAKQRRLMQAGGVVLAALAAYAFVQTAPGQVRDAGEGVATMV